MVNRVTVLVFTYRGLTQQNSSAPLISMKGIVVLTISSDVLGLILNRSHCCLQVSLVFVRGLSFWGYFPRTPPSSLTATTVKLPLSPPSYFPYPPPPRVLPLEQILVLVFPFSQADPHRLKSLAMLSESRNYIPYDLF